MLSDAGNRDDDSPLAPRWAEGADREAWRDTARARAEAEADRVARARAGAGLAREASPQILRAAPARGPMLPFTKYEVREGRDGQIDYAPDRWRHHQAMRVADVFDRLSGIPLDCVAVGRWYRDLSERVAAAGVRCSSAEAMAEQRGGAGGGQAAFLDAVLRDRADLRRAHDLIGLGVAAQVRRVRPSVRGSRRSISDRSLVDGVCIGDQGLGAVLTAHGWASEGKARKLLRSALVGALWRLVRGFD